MKKTSIAIIVVALIAILLAGSCFTVFENEYACTVRFSKIISTLEAVWLREHGRLQLCRRL